ncbi:hypothetical protein FLW53_09725 [Microbispora sp. SCL1-1]|uniref:hypothetical protein n=1 Tax=unclassified Microbispora TaxID=2614687 RepID=UPI001159DFDB|nr:MULTISPECIES: hypothetical protein [unclassified Microbispora]NJP24483.1 hypothetical protein [Microbispora sp. CL1-1]TQS14629.1 hypothetical protein FLW53_09725 [Microbispora sp. SCL1-1]
MSKDLNEAAAHAAALIATCYEQMPILFAPGVALQAIWGLVADHGYDHDDETMLEILNLAMNHGAPAEVIKPMIEAWDIFTRVYSRLE